MSETERQRREDEAMGGFRVSGPERDHLVKYGQGEISAAFWRMEPDLRDLDPGPPTQISEMVALLSDTGWEHDTGEDCILSSLPLPQLAEWFKRMLADHREWHEECLRDSERDIPDSRQRLELSRELRGRLQGQLEGTTAEEVAV
jgi:hypothetical protein